MPSERTINKALDALDGMDSIVENEMIKRGVYVTEEVVNPKLADEGAICGGRQACAIGSLYLGYGVRLVPDHWGDLTLPGVEIPDRYEFVANRPGLKLALDALNAEAEAYIKRNRLSVPENFPDAIENLFEADKGDGYFDAAKDEWVDATPILRRADLRRIIKRARARIAA